MTSLLASSAHAAHPSIGLSDDVKLVIDAQYRPRMIADTGRDFRDGDSPAYVSHRARLGMSLINDEGWRITVRFQDVRIWGEELNTLNDFTANGFDAHEAYIVIPAMDSLDIKIGRQEVVYDNSRLVGNVGWVQRARSFDGVRVNWKSKMLDGEVFYAKLIEADDREIDGNVPPGRTSDMDFVTVRFVGRPIADHSVSVMYLWRAGYTPKNERHTMGFFAKGKTGPLWYSAEFFYQAGTLGSESVSALLGAGRIKYTLDTTASPSVMVWGEYLSGDGTPEGTFDTLFATNHKFYGEMDLFLAIPRHTGNQGLIDLGGRIAAKPSKKLSLLVDTHYFIAADSGDAFGIEIDAKAQLVLSKALKVRALYGIFLGSDAIRATRGFASGADLELEHLVYVTMDFAI